MDLNAPHIPEHSRIMDSMQSATQRRRYVTLEDLLLSENITCDYPPTSCKLTSLSKSVFLSPIAVVHGRFGGRNSTMNWWNIRPVLSPARRLCLEVPRR